MAQKLGRNDLCLCGSGKKFKNCCIDTLSKPSNVIDLGWSTVRALEETLADNHLLPFAKDELPNEVVESALLDFFPADFPEEADRERYFNQFFLPWFLFSWIPGETFEMEDFSSDEPIAIQYIKKYGETLNKREKDFIKTVCASYYSFYSVQEVEPEKSLLLKDIFTGESVRVKERMGTRRANRGDVFYTRVVHFEGQSIMVGMAPLLIPSQFNSQLVEFKQSWLKFYRRKKITPQILKEELAEDLLDFFYSIVMVLYTPQKMMMRNTDGDPIEFHKSYFKMELSLLDAFERLKALTLEEVDDILEGAKRNKKGEIVSLEFPWQKKGNSQIKGWTNTILGTICLTPGKLTLEVNSAKRSKKGIQEINKRLGLSVNFQKTLIESFDQKMHKSSSHAKSRNFEKEQEELLSNREVRDQIEEMAREHWNQWFDMKIPALGDKTPRQAVKTKGGCELLEALLLDYERSNQNKTGSAAIFNPDVEFLKRELGIG